MFLYIIIEDDGDYSSREWKVIGVHRNIRNASIQAWQHVVDIALKHEFMAKWWYDPGKKASKERATYKGIGSDVHILEWDMTNNEHTGTWYIEKNDAFRDIGGKGENRFMSTLHNWRTCLQEAKRVPSMLWFEYMRYAK